MNIIKNVFRYMISIMDCLKEPPFNKSKCIISFITKYHPKSVHWSRLKVNYTNNIQKLNCYSEAARFSGEIFIYIIMKTSVFCLYSLFYIKIVNNIFFVWFFFSIFGRLKQINMNTKINWNRKILNNWKRFISLYCIIFFNYDAEIVSQLNLLK